MSGTYKYIIGSWEINWILIELIIYSLKIHIRPKYIMAYQGFSNFSTPTDLETERDRENDRGRERVMQRRRGASRDREKHTEREVQSENDREVQREIEVHREREAAWDTILPANTKVPSAVYVTVVKCLDLDALAELTISALLRPPEREAEDKDRTGVRKTRDGKKRWEKDRKRREKKE